MPLKKFDTEANKLRKHRFSHATLQSGNEKRAVAAKKARATKKKVYTAIEKGGIITDEELSVVRKPVDESKILFQPNEGPQYDFLAASETQVLYGGAAGGGKSYGMLMDALRYAHVPHYRALLLRRTLNELKELIDKSKQVYPLAFKGARFKETDKEWNFPSGAKMYFSYVDRDSDVYQYQGQAFQWIGIDELGHYSSPYVWNYLASRLRDASDNPVPLAMRATANPGGAGGHWIKEMFIDPAPPNTAFWATDLDTKKTLTDPDTNKPLFQRKFIPAKLSDNPYLIRDSNYRNMLLSLPKYERDRLLDGNWDVVQDCSFPEFNHATHVITKDNVQEFCEQNNVSITYNEHLDEYDLPHNWQRFKGIDYGYSAPSCVLWGAVDFKGNLYIYRELYKKHLTGADLGAIIRDMESYDPPSYLSALDKSCWNKTGHGLSIAEQVMQSGVSVIPSNSDRTSGKIQVHQRLREPSIIILDNCTNLIRTLPILPLAPNNPEDVDTHSEDHAYDALRYLVMLNPSNTARVVTHNTSYQRDRRIIYDQKFGY